MAAWGSGVNQKPSVGRNTRKFGPPTITESRSVGVVEMSALNSKKFWCLFGRVHVHTATLYIAIFFVVFATLFLVYDVFIGDERYERFNLYDIAHTFSLAGALMLLVGSRFGCFLLCIPYLAIQVLIQAGCLSLVVSLMIKSIFYSFSPNDYKKHEEETEELNENITLTVLLLLYGILNAYCMKVVGQECFYLKEKSSGLTGMW